MDGIFNFMRELNNTAFRGFTKVMEAFRENCDGLEAEDYGYNETNGSVWFNVSGVYIMSIYGEDVIYMNSDSNGNDVEFDNWYDAYTYDETDEEDEEITVSDEELLNILKNVVLYEDKDKNECSVCLVSDKNQVIVPCGHYHTCKECVSQLEECPICRVKIEYVVGKDLFDSSKN